MSATFKVGDRVRVKTNDMPSLDGRTGTIVLIHTLLQSFPVDVEIDGLSRHPRYFSFSELERLDGAA